MSKHEEYWQKRAEERLVDSEQIALRAEKVMQKAFKAAAKDIELQIYKLYGKYAQDNQLSYAETLAYLTNDELAEFQQDLHFYIVKMQDREYRTAYKAYLQALSTRARVKRLEAYQAQLQMIADELYYGQVIPAATEAAVAIVQDSYLKSAFDLSRGIGLLLSFQQPSAKVVDTILEYPWSGKNFSRKWSDNCANFEAVLNETLTKGLITGASNQRMAEELAIKTNNAYNNAIRLVRTETNYIHNAASAAFSEEVGIEKYQFMATLDLRTSTICRSLDGEIFSYADKKTGVNYPPMHPWCRSTKVDVIDEEWLRQGTRVARDKDGKTIKVPRDMTYQDWYEKYVKGDPEYLKQERMLKNRHADKRQYEKYKAAFGDTKMLKSLDEFLEMKYNKPRAWQALKEQYRLSQIIERERLASPFSFDVDQRHIKSKKYRERFKNLFANPKTNEAVYKAAKMMLQHRDGTPFEDMYLIDEATGAIVGISNNDSKVKGVVYNSSIKKALAEHGENTLIAMHNHPQGFPPSAADINAVLNNTAVRYGMTIGHNGTIYRYTQPKKFIVEDVYEKAFKSFKELGYSEETCQEKALKFLQQEYDFKLEVL